MKIKTLIVSILFVFSLVVNAQSKNFGFDDIFSNPDFFAPSLSQIHWMNGGEKYSYLRYAPSDRKYEIVIAEVSPKNEEVVLSGRTIASLTEDSKNIKWYEWSPDERYLLITTYLMPRYDKPGGDIIIYDTKEDYFHKITAGENKQWVPGFTNDSRNVVFVRNDNLFIYSLETYEEKQLTYDGDGTVINGHFDWVYQEELDAVRGWVNSDDGRYLAFWRFDQTNVPEVQIAKWDSLYFNFLNVPYQKAGEKNSLMDIDVYDLSTDSVSTIMFEDEEEYYIPKIYSVPGANKFAIEKINRLQNERSYLFCDLSELSLKTVISESSKGWLNTDSELHFFPSKKLFTNTSDKNGYNHIYVYDYDGNEKSHINIGAREVKEVCAVDDKRDRIYFTANIRGTIYTDLYRTDINGENITRLTNPKGEHNVSLGDNPLYFVDVYNNVTHPNVTSVYNMTGERLYLIGGKEENVITQYGLNTPEFTSFVNEDGIGINMMLIKPADYDPAKKYPVLVYNYSGPGSQIVKDSWGGMNMLWHHYLAKLGYIVVYIDNRGTGGRGTDFRFPVYKQLGTYEVEDLAAGAEYLTETGIAMKERIGIWGWSYGGYTSALTLAKKPEIFSMAISVAPVTDWHFYDNIYTERYMSMPSLNEEGYKSSSVLTHAANIKGDLLVVHGTADDNVHFQNTVKLAGKLIENDIQFRSFFYPEKNHSIYGGNTRKHLYRMLTDFILEKL